MSAASEWLRLALGGVLVYFGAEWFVAGASSLALALRIPKLLVGLTVVAYGTSAPEIIVGVQAARAGHGDVALGNVIGSNVANIGLILGVAALIRPPRVDGALRRRELPVLVASAALIPILLLDGVIGRWEGAALLVASTGYTVWMIRAAREPAAAVRSDARAVADATEAAGAPAAGTPAPAGGVRAGATAALGLLVLLIGGDLFVDGAVAVARALGMSDRLVGLTIVAVGTSLPELVTSVIAARRGHSELAVGNVVGSNIFNTFLCLGASALAGGIAASPSAFAFDLAALGVMTTLGVALLRSERTVRRLEAAVAVALYAVFLLLTVARG